MITTGIAPLRRGKEDSDHGNLRLLDGDGDRSLPVPADRRPDRLIAGIGARRGTGAQLAAIACLAASCCATAVGAAEPAASAPAPDSRVEATLKAAGLGYLLDQGDFRLDYKVDEQRSQRVWVASDTTSLPPLELRDVWSVAARGAGRVPPELAARLLQENVRMVLGAWQVNQGKEEYLVVFAAQVDAAADAPTLREVIEVVMYSADRIEKEISGKDEF